jgi:hypothetical protein
MDNDFARKDKEGQANDNIATSICPSKTHKRGGHLNENCLVTCQWPLKTSAGNKEAYKK